MSQPDTPRPSPFAEPDTLLRALAREGEPEAVQALDFIDAHPADALPVLQASLERVLATLRANDNDPSAVDDLDAVPLWLGLTLLGELRHTPAHDAVVELARSSGEVLDELLGELINDGLEHILWRTSGGRVDGILSVLDDADASLWARGAAARALVAGALEDELDHDTAVELLRERLVLPGDPRLEHWPEATGFHDASPQDLDDHLVTALCHLWPERAAETIRQVFEAYPPERTSSMTLPNKLEDILELGRDAHLQRERESDRRFWQASVRLLRDFAAGRLMDTLAPRSLTRRNDAERKRRRKLKRKARKRNRRK